MEHNKLMISLVFDNEANAIQYIFNNGFGELERCFCSHRVAVVSMIEKGRLGDKFNFHSQQISFLSVLFML